MKKIITVIIAALLMAPLATPAYALSNEAGNREQPTGLYNLNTANNKNIFANNVDGYSLQIDKGMNVDMSYSSVYTVLENNDKRIEIFKQPLSGISKAGYIDYSNKFIENTFDHKVEYNGNQTIAGRQVHILSWNRAKLSR
ncbi:MAG: hypothetical protein JJE17_07250, partial [Peptostreptococcaceae bacterium]|nr:hypothetical protein [Peptostreptococcaceae bacterium]